MNKSIPKVLGRYEIQGEIGRGMMGIVYRAMDPALGRTVALKTVHLAFDIPDDDGQSFEKRFLTEARVAGGLSHPGIVVVHDVGRDDGGTLYIALEYLEGRTLSDVVSSQGPLPWRQALQLTSRLADALSHAHDRGVVHRDIKPANIMMQPSGEPKIMDFGIAKVSASQLTNAGEFFGTPSYMSPEQANGTAVDGRSDLFSLGSVLYYLLTGKRAFHAGTVPGILAKVANVDPPMPSTFTAELPSDVDTVLSRALAKDPEQRYQSGRVMAEDIEDVLAGRSPRHCGAWRPPARSEEGTLTSVRDLLEPAEASTAPPAANATATKHRGGGRFAGAKTWIVGVLLLVLGGGFAYRLLSAVGAAPGRLEVVCDHPLKSGTLKLWVDDDLELEAALDSRVVKKILSYEVRRGTVSELLEVSPGERLIRVQVLGEGYDASDQIRGTFQSGIPRRLEVRVGRIVKNVSLEWAAASATR